MFKALAILFDSNDSRVEVHDLLAAVAFVAIVGFEAWALSRGEEYDVSAFGEALGIVLGGGAAGAVGASVLRRGVRLPGRSITGASEKPDDPDGR